ncbi:MAG: NAD-dependent epimerase/dehydratase family protein [Bacteroidota bacterium]
MNFITGASGFVGSYLAKKLIDRGEMVVSLKRPSTRMDLLGKYASQIKWYEGDILDVPSLEIAMKGVSKVFHCAAKISFDKKSRAIMYKVHAEGTANIVNVSLYHGIKKYLHVSSIAALPSPKHGETIDENSEWSTNPYPAHYGKSKFMAEREAYRAMTEGINTIIVNPGTIIGAGFWHEGSGSFFSNIHKGLPFYTDGVVGFVDVRDVVDCMIQLMDSDIKNDKFILSGYNESFKNFFTAIAQKMNRKAPQYKVNKVLGEIAIASDFLQTLFTEHTRMITSETIQLANLQANYDNSKIINALNYKFIPLDKTIKDTTEAFLQSVKLQKDFAVFEN